jgi:transposase
VSCCLGDRVHGTPEGCSRWRSTGEYGEAVRVEGRSQRAVAREFGISRETVRKMLEYAVPPGYQRQQPIKRPKLGPWLGVIDAILKDDKQRPAKQRHTAKRIFERLKAEHGFTGGYTIVKDNHS